MILAAAFALVTFQAKLRPEDFFPRTPGLKLTYEDSEMPDQMIRTILPEITVKNMALIPIETTIVGHRSKDVINYRVDDNGVYMVWVDERNRPVKSQQPLFLWEGGNGKWSFEGFTQVTTVLEPLSLKGETRPNGIKSVLGNKVETILVKLDAVVRNGESQIKSHMELVLAKGIGVVEQRESSSFGGKKYKRTLKLVTIQQPEGN